MVSKHQQFPPPLKTWISLWNIAYVTEVVIVALGYVGVSSALNLINLGQKGPQPRKLSQQLLEFCGQKTSTNVAQASLRSWCKGCVDGEDPPAQLGNELTPYTCSQ